MTALNVYKPLHYYSICLQINIFLSYSVLNVLARSITMKGDGTKEWWKNDAVDLPSIRTIPPGPVSQKMHSNTSKYI